MNALTFNQVSLNPVSQSDSQIWITSAELAKALGYKAVDSVTKIFNRNSDEFTEQMTLTVKLTVKGFGNGLSEKAVRIFSLRGCYAIAFFAKTEVAKQFRRWVLDLIENEAQKYSGRTTTSDERTGLRNAVDAIVTKKGLLFPDAYRLVHQRFNVGHIDELSLEQVGEATEYLHRLLLDVELSPVGIVMDNGNFVNLAESLYYSQKMRMYLELFLPAFRSLQSKHAEVVRELAHDHGSVYNNLALFAMKQYPNVTHVPTQKKLQEIFIKLH